MINLNFWKSSFNLLTCVVQWLERLPDNCLARVHKSTSQENFATVYIPSKNRYCEKCRFFFCSGCCTLNPTAFRPKQKPFPHLQEVTDLYVWLGSRILRLEGLGHWHQRFQRILSWDKATWCNLLRQKFRTTRWVWFQILFHTSLPEYRCNKK